MNFHYTYIVNFGQSIQVRSDVCSKVTPIQYGILNFVFFTGPGLGSGSSEAVTRQFSALERVHCGFSSE